MPFTSHRKLTAWLGLFAIWLAVVMPVISQNVQSRQVQELSFSICSPGEQATVLTIALNDEPSQSPHHDGKACAYCGLLADHAPVHFAVAIQGYSPSWDVPQSQAAAYTPQLAPSYPNAQPRAPPALFS